MRGVLTLNVLTPVNVIPTVNVITPVNVIPTVNVINFNRKCNKFKNFLLRLRWVLHLRLSRLAPMAIIDNLYHKSVHILF